MYRVYYLVPNLQQVRNAISRLDTAGIGGDRIHVMARDAGELDRHGINATTPWEDTDIMSNGYSGATRGLLIGLIAGYAIAFIDPWGVDAHLGVWLLTALFFTCFGAWAGGLRGISQANHHLSPYLQSVKNGNYLILIDVDRKHERNRVHQALDHHIDIRNQSEEEHFSPLA